MTLFEDIMNDVETWKSTHGDSPPDSILIQHDVYLKVCKELGISILPPEFKDKTGLSPTTLNKFELFNKNSNTCKEMKYRS